MIDREPSGFRRWLKTPLFSMPAASARSPRRLEMSPANLGILGVFIIVMSVIASAAEAAKPHVAEWLAAAVSAIVSALSSRYAIPVLLLLILFALWSGSATADGVRSEIAELSDRVDALERRLGLNAEDFTDD